jgi:DNA-binding response OmpR family regulator
LTRILVVDDEEEIRALLVEVLQGRGFEVVTAEDGAAALEQVPRQQPAVILLDLTMPRLNGLEALPEIKRLDPEVPVIICTAHADLPTAVRAMKLGAYDYITKPFDMELLGLALDRAVERRQLRSRIEELRRQGTGALAERMGGSAAVAAVIQQVSQVAESNFTLLLQGETDRQGAGGARHPPAEPPPAGAVRGGGLWRDPGDPRGVGALRPRARGLHRRPEPPGGQVPARPGRHPVPRRDREHPARDAGQAPAGAGTTADSSGRERPRSGGRCACAGCDE